MRDIKNAASLFVTLGTIIAGLSVGFVIELGRSEQMRTQALIEACFLSLISYFTPTLWLRWRYRDKPNWVWLIIPSLGSVLVYLTVVLIPNEISIWNRSSGTTFVANAIDSLPNQLFNFFFGFLLFSAISSIIIGLAQLIGLGFLQFRRLLNKRSAAAE